MGIGKRTYWAARTLYARWHNELPRLARRISPVLSSSEAPEYYDDKFDELQSAYFKWWADYDYDAYSTWRRGCERALSLLKRPELQKPSLNVLDAGCGDGMTGVGLASYGHQVTLNDSEDWRDARAKPLKFVQGDICGTLPLASESFDLAISYNAFEHVDNPAKALNELVRLCKRGGLLYIEFDPLYSSPLGLHAFSFFMPYPQFLFSPKLIETKLRELSVRDLGRTSAELQATNKWRLSQFRDLWRESGCEVVSLVEGIESRQIGAVEKFPNAFRGRGLTIDDLTVSAIAVMLRKR